MVKSKLIAALAMLAIACGNNMNDIETQTEDVDSVATPLISVRSKTCSVDGNHWAEVNANVNSAGMMTSYSIKYKTSGGWRLGTSNNEHVSCNGSVFYNSPDSCVPNSACNRPMPDRRASCVKIVAVFDREGDDPRCSMSF